MQIKNHARISAAAISFVAFEGWELLLFGQDRMKDPKATARRAICLPYFERESLADGIGVLERAL